MGMASDLLERLSEDLEVLSLHTRAYLDEFGTLLCYLEGGRGGGTTLLHAPYPRPAHNYCCCRTLRKDGVLPGGARLVRQLLWLH